MGNWDPGYNDILKITGKLEDVKAIVMPLEYANVIDAFNEPDGKVSVVIVADRHGDENYEDYLEEVFGDMQELLEKVDIEEATMDESCCDYSGPCGSADGIQMIDVDSYEDILDDYDFTEEELPRKDFDKFLAYKAKANDIACKVSYSVRDYLFVPTNVDGIIKNGLPVWGK